MPADTEGIVTFSIREILDGINDKLAKSAVLGEQLNQRMSTVETRLAAHDKILSEQIPKFQRIVEDLDVQAKVEAALDSRRVRGISNLDRIVVSAIGACVLALGGLQYLPHLFQ